LLICRGRLNISGLGKQQFVVYYIALGQYPSVGYIQPVILFTVNETFWELEWIVQAYAPGETTPEYNKVGLIAYGQGSSVQLNDLFNLTIKATLNSQGEITQAYVYIANAKTGQVYFSNTISLSQPIPDKKVFFEVEDPYNSEYQVPYPFPIIPSSNYVFVDAFASNSTFATSGLPFWNDIEFVMGSPYAFANVTPTFGLGTQGVQYYW